MALATDPTAKNRESSNAEPCLDGDAEAKTRPQSRLGMRLSRVRFLSGLNT